MTATMTRALAVAAAAALAVVLTGCTETPAPPETVAPPTVSTRVTDGACTDGEGATLIVDASALDGGSVQEWCHAIGEELPVVDLLEDARVSIQGSAEFPDFPCRVNGLPSGDAPLGSTADPDYVETCASTAPSFGYWGLWVQRAGSQWGSAQEGIATLTAYPGDRIGLLFTLDGEPAAPTS